MGVTDHVGETRGRPRASISHMDDHMSWRQGQSIAAVTLASMVLAFVVASGLAYVASGAGVPWWVVTPVAWVVVYLIMRTMLRSFFTRRLPSN